MSEYRTLALLLEEIVKFDQDYDKREEMIYQALVEAKYLGLECGIRIPSKDDDPEWPVVFIDLPEYLGEVAWHIKAVDKVYDGHSTDEKFERISQLSELVAKNTHRDHVCSF